MNFAMGGRGAINPVMAQGRGGADTLPAWATAGGAPRPIACYQPKGAASLAASYVNLANPGTYDAAPGTAPTFNTATGWTFAAAQYLTTGIAPTATIVVLVRFSDVSTSADNYLFGVRQTIAKQFFCLISRADGNRGFAWMTYQPAGTRTLAGTAAIVGRTTAADLYVNGSYIITKTATAAYQSESLIIGGVHNVYTPSYELLTGTIQAGVIWNTSTNAASWVPAVSAAVALI